MDNASDQLVDAPLYGPDHSSRSNRRMAGEANATDNMSDWYVPSQTGYQGTARPKK